jgi:hypothetical protein
VGNRAFAKSYNRRVFKTLRVENGNDIVTRVPPAFSASGTSAFRSASGRCGCPGDLV